MNIIAFDTCFGACSVAVRLTAGPGEHQQIDSFKLCETGHAEALMPMIRSVMAQAGAGFDALDRIAVTRGPGTFTGTRIGIAAAKGLALAARLPLIGVSSLAVMAATAVRQLANDEIDEQMAVAVDARRGQLYVQLFGRAGLSPKSEPLLQSLDEAARIGGDRPIVFVGSGAEAVALEARHLGRAAKARLPRLQPHAADLAAMACELEPVAGPLHPLYLREADITIPPVKLEPRRT